MMMIYWGNHIKGVSLRQKLGPQLGVDKVLRDKKINVDKVLRDKRTLTY